MNGKPQSFTRKIIYLDYRKVIIKLSTGGISLNSNAQVIIYGTGSLSKKITDELRGIYEILFYLESNQDRSGKYFEGKEIKNPEILTAINNKVLVVIASSFYDEIKIILCRMGLQEHVNFIDGTIFLPKYHAEVSYSQNGEDIILNNIMRKETGFYVDIGSYHPIRFSNTFKFYQKGWTGINIEPTPNKIHLFNIVRPKDINLEVGVSSKDEQKELYIYKENAYNTLNENLAQERFTNLGLNYEEKAILTFKRLDTIFLELELNGLPIDFMNIDVEGHELEVLKSNDWNLYSPKVIAVEIFNLEESSVLSFLLEQGYILEAKTPNTAIFKKMQN